MESLFIKEQITYTGKELSPHWIYRNFKLNGDSVVAFIGECKVDLSEMVDIEDVLNSSPIYSKKMLHFIAEHFNIPLIEGILRQRMLVVAAQEELSLHLENEKYSLNSLKVIRKGDDLFYNSGKLSVSIAAKSTNSVLIHLGINIDSQDAPVKAAGLESELGIKNIKKHEEIARQIMLNYLSEYNEIIKASCKVRGVL